MISRVVYVVTAKIKQFFPEGVAGMLPKWAFPVPGNKAGRSRQQMTAFPGGRPAPGPEGGKSREMGN